MEYLFANGDDLGPAKIVHVNEPSIGLHGVAVVDNVAAGPAIGGLRMAPDVTTEECLRLARAMTLKNAAAGLAHGGGKSVLVGDPRMPKEEKARLIRAFACALRWLDDYIIGPDMGTDEECMAWVHDEIGRAVGLPRALGGIPLDEIGATGWGMLHAIEAAMPQLDFPLRGARVAVQGLGAVGLNAARFLVEQGAVMVAAADSRGAVHDASGLDFQALETLKTSGRSVIESDGEVLKGNAIVGVDCDIWIPAARPDVIDESNVHLVRARLIVQGANIPVTGAAEAILHRRGVWCIPDFIANAGGVICAAMEYHGASERAAMDTVAEKIRRNTEEVLRRAREAGVLPREAAVAMARERVEAAMATHRWSIY